jgi:glutathione S-transferase
MDSSYRLITIPPSHYCEKARWALDYLGVPYREEGHPPLLHWWAVARAGGHRTTPVLVAGDTVLSDSTDILQYLDTTYVEGWRPYPRDSQLRVEAEEMEELFDTRLGPHTRRIAYYHLLQHKDLFLESVLSGVGRGESFVFRALRPAICGLMRRGMRITPESADRSLERVRTVFATVDELIDSGRAFLVGDRFSAADLTFAALAAPVLLPRNYSSPLPSLDRVPAEMLAQIEEFRTMPAGMFAMRIYRDHR